MLEKQQKLFIQDYNLEVDDVIKYTRKHRATVIATASCLYHMQAGFICVT